MQGTLNEIDIRSILQLLELGQRTGELLVEAYQLAPSPYRSDHEVNQNWPLVSNLPAKIPHHPQLCWFVFFVNGQIAYATDANNGSLVRLRDYLHHYQVQQELQSIISSTVASSNEPEYAYLWLLLEKHLLTPAQGRSIIHNMVSETLFDLLSLNQGSFVFDSAPALAPLLTTCTIGPLVTKTIKQVQQWKQFHPQLYSPDQCPVIADDLYLRNNLPDNSYQNLVHWAREKTSIRQLSRYLNRDILTIGRAIYPYIQKGWVQMSSVEMPTNPLPAEPLQVAPTNRELQVVCIDDDTTTGKIVEYILQEEGYAPTIIDNPIQALSRLFEIKPELIFCDIAMPQLDGYEICAMLRQSVTFRQTPIIMLTGKDGFIDRVRARMVGATDYLTKPFGKGELLMLLEKYLGRTKAFVQE